MSGNLLSWVHTLQEGKKRSELESAVPQTNVRNSALDTHFNLQDKAVDMTQENITIIGTS
jgi:hypothetical protein